MKVFKANVTTRTIRIGDEIHEVMDEAFCGGCGYVLYGYDEIICPSCGVYNDFD